MSTNRLTIFEIVASFRVRIVLVLCVLLAWRNIATAGKAPNSEEVRSADTGSLDAHIVLYLIPKLPQERQTLYYLLVNGNRLEGQSTAWHEGTWHWVRVPTGWLQTGENEIIVGCEAEEGRGYDLLFARDDEYEMGGGRYSYQGNTSRIGAGQITPGMPPSRVYCSPSKLAAIRQNRPTVDGHGPSAALAVRIMSGGECFAGFRHWEGSPFWTMKIPTTDMVPFSFLTRIRAIQRWLHCAAGSNWTICSRVPMVIWTIRVSLPGCSQSGIIARILDHGPWLRDYWAYYQG